MAKETFDTLFDNIVTRLDSYAASEAGVDPALGFAVVPDNMRVLGDSSETAWVIPRLDRLTFDDERSAIAESYGITAYYAVDCLVRAGSSSANASRATGSRLRYLVTQVVRALWVRTDWDLGLATGQINREPPSINIIDPEITRGERAIAGATVTLGAELAWDLEVPTGTVFDSVDADIGLWSALMEEE